MALARDDLRAARLLIVDDEEENLGHLQLFLEEEGYGDIVATADPDKALVLFQTYRPDLILFDFRTPHVAGIQLINQLRLLCIDEIVPILVISADGSDDARQAALAAGAKDFLSKPLSRIEVRLRIKNLLETRALHVALQMQKTQLEAQVNLRTIELERAKREILERLASAAEFRDDSTGEHTRRVGAMAAVTAENLGLPPETVDLIRQAAPLHDVGKIGIPDQILLKPAGLSPAEFLIMKRHTAIGARMLSGSISPTLQLAEQIALHHHERWDGSGYYGLSGDDVPIESRIVSVADIFDALTHDRPYKTKMTPDRALELIIEMRGRSLEARIVDAFIDGAPTEAVQPTILNLSNN